MTPSIRRKLSELAERHQEVAVLLAQPESAGDLTRFRELSKEYAAAAKAKGDDAVLIPLEGARHFELIDPRAKEFETVKQSILTLLK